MEFLVRVVRTFIWLLLISWSLWLLRRIVSWLLRDTRAKFQENQGAAMGSQAERSARRLVKDPVCGVHLDERLAVPLGDDGKVLHFCSTECRDRHLGGRREFAAHA